LSFSALEESLCTHEALDTEVPFNVLGETTVTEQTLGVVGLKLLLSRRQVIFVAIVRMNKTVGLILVGLFFMSVRDVCIFCFVCTMATFLYSQLVMDTGDMTKGDTK